MSTVNTHNTVTTPSSTMLTSACSRVGHGLKSFARPAVATQWSQSTPLLSTEMMARSVFGSRTAAFPRGISSVSRRTFMSQGTGPGEGNGKAAEGEKAGAEEHKAAAAVATEEEKDEQTKLIEKLTAENKELKDKVLYTLAEMENVRTIARRDMESAKQFALQSFAKQLLDVADNLGRALESVPQEILDNSEGGREGGLLATLVEGVAMTDTQLQKVFGANKIVKFGKPGDTFDPHLHDALFEYEEAGREGGSVGQVLKTGYTLNGRVIRPAQVGTVKKSS